MPMYITLNVPEKFPRWATDPNRTLEPSESLPGTPNKDEGHVESTRPPARVMNWLHNLSYQWLRKMMSPIVSNFWQSEVDIGNDATQCIYHPNFKKFLAITPSGSGVYFTVDGNIWNNNAVIADKQSVGMDIARYIIGDTSGNLHYSSDPDLVIWTQVNAATIGGSGAIKRIHTKYSDSSFIMVLRGTGIRIETTDVTNGSWVAPTTPPTIQATPTHGLIHIGDSTWIVYSGSGEDATTPTMEISTDDGDTWAGVAIEPFGTLDKPTCLAYSRDSARLMVAGRDSTNATWIRYSDDLGATWYNSYINLGVLPGSALADVTEPKSIYYCGGEAWVIVGSPVDVSNGYSGVLVSIDNGLTWHLPNINPTVVGGGTKTLNSVACGDRSIFLVGEPNGISFMSLSML